MTGLIIKVQPTVSKAEKKNNKKQDILYLPYGILDKLLFRVYTQLRFLKNNSNYLWGKFLNISNSWTH